VLSFQLLHANEISLLFMHPFKEILFGGGAYAVEIG
jgi:hypothetical protein